MSIAVATTLEERLQDLGNIPASRIRTNPAPGTATIEDVMYLRDTVRGPDVAFVVWNRLPDGRIPTAPIPDLVPNFVIEVLNSSNTYAEMSRKRREYFYAGVELLWMVEHRTRSVTVFRTAQDATVYKDEAILDGGQVLPGWSVDLNELFSRLDMPNDR